MLDIINVNFCPEIVPPERITRYASALTRIFLYVVKYIKLKRNFFVPFVDFMIFAVFLLLFFCKSIHVKRYIPIAPWLIYAGKNMNKRKNNNN